MVYRRSKVHRIGNGNNSSQLLTLQLLGSLYPPTPRGLYPIGRDAVKLGLNQEVEVARRAGVTITKSIKKWDSGAVERVESQGPWAPLAPELTFSAWLYTFQYPLCLRDRPLSNYQQYLFDIYTLNSPFPTIPFINFCQRNWSHPWSALLVFKVHQCLHCKETELWGYEAENIQDIPMFEDPAFLGSRFPHKSLLTFTFIKPHESVLFAIDELTQIKEATSLLLLSFALFLLRKQMGRQGWGQLERAGLTSGNILKQAMPFCDILL